MTPLKNRCDNYNVNLAGHNRRNPLMRLFLKGRQPTYSPSKKRLCQISKLTSIHNRSV
jgi:hypothetical protein